MAGMKGSGEGVDTDFVVQFSLLVFFRDCQLLLYNLCYTWQAVRTCLLLRVSPRSTVGYVAADL